jgi:hypothetical protein
MHCSRRFGRCQLRFGGIRLRHDLWLDGTDFLARGGRKGGWLPIGYYRVSKSDRQLQHRRWHRVVRECRGHPNGRIDRIHHSGADDRVFSHLRCPIAQQRLAMNEQPALGPVAQPKAPR